MTIVVPFLGDVDAEPPSTDVSWFALDEFVALCLVWSKAMRVGVDMRKITAVSAAVVMVLTVWGGVAGAGEITGSGKQTPIKARQTEEAPAGPAQSFCAFSGLNDMPTGNEDPIEDGRVQSWGDGVQEFARMFGGVSEFTDVIHEEGPGAFCHGFPSGGPVIEH